MGKILFFLFLLCACLIRDHFSILVLAVNSNDDKVLYSKLSYCSDTSAQLATEDMLAVLKYTFELPPEKII